VRCLTKEVNPSDDVCVVLATASAQEASAQAWTFTRWADFAHVHPRRESGMFRTSGSEHPAIGVARVSPGQTAAEAFHGVYSWSGGSLSVGREHIGRDPGRDRELHRVR